MTNQKLKNKILKFPNVCDWKKEAWGYMNKKDSHHQINWVNREHGKGIVITKFANNENYPKFNVIANKTFKDRNDAVKFVKNYIKSCRKIQ